MDLIRRNTIIFDLRDVPQLSILGQHVWLINELEIPLEKIDVVDYNMYKKFGVVKFVDEASFEAFKGRFNAMEVPLTDEEGGKHNIRYRINNDRSKRIRITQLTTCESMGEIKNFFEKYGKILNCEWEKNRVKIGDKILETRREVLRMDMEMAKEIPSFIKYKGATLMVTYYGQIKTCAICTKAGHKAKECPTKGKPLAENQIKTGSYAAIAAKKTEWNQKGKRATATTLLDYIIPQKNKFIELSEDSEDDTNETEEEIQKKNYSGKPKNAKIIKISSPRSERRNRQLKEVEEPEKIEGKNSNDSEEGSDEEKETREIERNKTNEGEEKQTELANEDETNADVFEAPTPNLCKSQPESTTERECTLIRGMYPKSVIEDSDEKDLNSSHSN